MNNFITQLSGLLTPLIALIAAMIALQQWITNKRQQETNVSRLKHELYDKRFAIYDAARTFLRRVITSDEVTNKHLDEYWAGINPARFLLDDELTDYLEKIQNKAVDLQTNKEIGKGPEGLAPGAKERNELRKWFYTQIKTLNEKFTPYLKLEH